MLLFKNFLVSIMMVWLVSGCGATSGGEDNNTADTTVPVITLTGSAEVNITKGDSYTDAGATASDDTDGDITANIVTSNPVDTSTVGTYHVTYNVSDAAGNAATEVTRTVNVQEAPDTTAPVITLTGSTEVNVTKGDSYTDAGATASDDTDGDITANITTVNPVDTNTVATYTVTYNVSDAAGNAATEVTRTVNVQEVPDTTVPVISLTGSAEVNVTKGDTYTDAGATANDDRDGDITANITTVNPVDTNTVATYTVTYNVSDAAGNAATEVTRTVNVQEAPDTTVPVITLTGSAEVNVTKGDAYTDQGATANDDTDGDITANIVTNNPVDTNTVATYTVTYNVSDAAGNAATEVTRTVNVQEAPDTTVPVITLTGSAEVNVTKGDSYTDAGATANDDTDGDITANITTVNPVDTNTVATYTVTYNVSDAAGNAATEVTRTVNVQEAPDTTVPVITLTGSAEVNVTKGDSYTDAGATANDDTDGDITANIVTNNPVDTNTVATYTVTYNVSDAAGNAATEVTRTVNVVDPLEAVSLTLDINVSGWLRPSSDENGTRDINFTGESNDTASIASWSYDLGDGLTASDQNATRRYTAEGNYTVTLTATDTNGFDHTATADVNITAYNTVERWLNHVNGEMLYEADFGDVNSTTGGSAFEDDGAGKLVPSATQCHFTRNDQGDIQTASIQTSTVLGHFCLTWTPDGMHYVIVDYKENDAPAPYFEFLHHDDGTGYGTLPFDEARIYTPEEHRINQVFAGATDIDGNTHGLTGMDNNTSLYLYNE